MISEISQGSVGVCAPVQCPYNNVCPYFTVSVSLLLPIVYRGYKGNRRSVRANVFLGGGKLYCDLDRSMGRSMGLQVRCGDGPLTPESGRGRQNRGVMRRISFCKCT